MNASVVDILFELLFQALNGGFEGVEESMEWYLRYLSCPIFVESRTFLKREYTLRNLAAKG
ncbi:hypothetical protein ACFL6U_28845 [Planctomycetota bacterium]